MTPPPYLLGIAALFWGWQTGSLLLGLAIALALEAPRALPQRLTLQPLQWNRIADLCTALFLLVGFYAWLSGGWRPVVVRIFQWLPLAVLPLALAQAWASESRVALSVLFVSLRRVPDEEREQVPRINLGWPYLGVLLIGAAAANLRSPGVFYTGMAVLVGWALWRTRSRRYRRATWIATLALAAGLGYAGMRSLESLQGLMEDALAEWLVRRAARPDPYRSSTAMGAIGELKRSPRIVLRVPAAQGTGVPERLARSSYDGYASQVWRASGRLERQRSAADGSRWILREVPAASTSDAQTLRIVSEMEGGATVLALPAGSYALSELPVDELAMNALGAVQVRLNSSRVSYAAHYRRNRVLAAAPRSEDLLVPVAEAAALDQAYAESGMAGVEGGAVLERLGAWLNERYRYSIWQGEAPPQGRTALAHFLLDTRAGHCEYFASATVLLLRRAGIPARYVTGFALHEWSALEGAYVARARDAHAWAIAWVDGAWHEVDTTPADWIAVEDGREPAWSRLADLWSWARYRLSTLDDATASAWMLALGGVLSLWLTWRIGLRKHGSLKSSLRRASGEEGGDSPWYELEQRLARRGLAPATGETAREFARRCAQEQPELAAGLGGLVALHYRYRFDPAADRPPLKRELQLQVHALLARIDRPG